MTSRFAPRHVAFALLFLLPLAACGDAPAEVHHAEAEHADGEHGGDDVTLTAEALESAGVTVEAVQARPLAQTFSAPARVVASLTGSAHVGPLVAGRVVRLYAGEGSGVRRGGPLAEVESMDVADLQGDYLTASADVTRAGAGIATAEAQIERAQAALTREEALAAENLTPRSEVEQAREDARTARAARTAAVATRQAALAVQAAARTKLATLGLGAPSGRGGAARFTVRSPIGGTVTARAAQIGDYVEPSRDMFEIAAQGSGTVEAQVSPAQAEGLRVGGLATVVAADSARYAARIVAVSPTVNAESRTVPVRVEMVSGRMRPEAFATVAFETAGARPALVVPEAAIERADGGTFVYTAVDGEPGAFRRVAVEIGQATGVDIEVRAGLTAGDRIATAGVFYLRSARQRGELAEHDH